jgi:hypothetical protein
VTHDPLHSLLQIWVVKFSCMIKLFFFHTTQLIANTEKSGSHSLVFLLLADKSVDNQGLKIYGY